MPATATEKPKSKSSKPLMEKRRRARINDSLMQLKSLVLDALNKNNSRHSKLEKADILEMTVRYLRTIQRQQISASANADPAVLGQYRSGYAECVNEVTRYLGTSPSKTADGGDAPELRTRLVGHLADMCTSGQQQERTVSSVPQQQSSPVFQMAQSSYQPHQQRSDVLVDGAVYVTSQPTNAQHQRIPGVPEGAKTEYSPVSPVLYNTAPRGQMSPVTQQRAQSPTNSTYQMVQNIGVAGSLPSGEITLVLPQQSLPNGQLPTHLIPVYAPAAGSAAILSPTSAANCITNIPSTAATSCHVSMSSPRAAATVPSMQSPTAPQSSMTIPAQHALVTTQTSSQVAYRVPVQQTNISPVHGGFSHQIRIEPARAEIQPVFCAKTDDPMWRPW